MQNEEINNADDNAPQLKEKVETSMIAPTPNNPPWNGWAAVGVWAASVFFIILFPNLFLLTYILTSKLQFSDQTQLIEFVSADPTAVILSMVAIIPAHLFTLILAWLVVTNFNKFSFRQTLGWEWNGFKIWHAVVIFVLFYGVALLLTAVFGDVENEFEKMLKSSRAVVYLVAFFATFTAPLVEEVVYRGLLYSAFQRRFGIILSVIFITSLFTAVHIPQYSNQNIPDYASLITILFLSLTLTLIRVRTNNLLPCIVLHTVVNGVQSVILIAEPYLPGVPADAPQQAASIIGFLT